MVLLRSASSQAAWASSGKSGWVPRASVPETGAVSPLPCSVGQAIEPKFKGEEGLRYTMCLDERGVKEFGSHVLGLTNLTSATSLQ